MNWILVSALLVGALKAQQFDCADSNNTGFDDLASVLNSIEDKESVEEILCRGAGLSGSIPSEITELINLRVLDVGGNKLEGDLPSNLADLPNLEVIKMEDNCLTGNVFNRIFSMEDLAVLQLDGNKFEGELVDLPLTLTEFSAEFNDFSDEIPITLGDLENLETFNVIGNRLSGSIPNVLANLSLISFFIDNNDLEGTVPPHSAQFTDAPPGSTLSRASLSERFQKYTLPSKCPNRYTFALEKMFRVNLLYTVLILVGLLLVCIGFMCCCFCFCCKKKEVVKRLKSLVSAAGSTVYDDDHYKIEVYLCHSDDLTDKEEALKENFRSELKKHHVRPTCHTALNNNVDEAGMLDSAAIIILFSEKYLGEMLDESATAFHEVRWATGVGQWIVFACLERKIFIRGNTQTFLDGDYHMFDISSEEALTKNIDEIMKNLYQAQAEKEALQHVVAE